MPKRKDKKKGKVLKKKEIDWAADANFDKNRSMIYVEHTLECPIFQTKAEQVQVFLQERIPDRVFQLVRNMSGKQQPREGAFEINFAQNARTSSHNLWSGIDKGPPRREKFPKDLETLVPQVRVILKKVYVDLSEQQQEEEDYFYDGPVVDLATEGGSGEESV